VPPIFSQQYVEEKRKSREDVLLVTIPQADHFDLVDPRSAAWPRVEATVMDSFGRA
jgi:hypothetical protein